MATTKKTKAASPKSAGKPAKKTPAKADAKPLSKKASVAPRLSSKKATRLPTPSAKKPVTGKATPVAKPKGSKKPVPQPKPVKKGAPAPVVPRKDLIKKIVKTAPAHALKAPLRIATKAPAKVPAKPATPSEPKKSRFNKADLDQFKVELLAMRDRIIGQSGSMRNDALQRTDEMNPEEDGTDAFLRLQTLEQVSSQQLVITNIDESLRAIEKGTYGVCDACGELINKPRLSVLPFAKNCIKCQSEMERPNRPGGRR